MHEKAYQCFYTRVFVAFVQRIKPMSTEQIPFSLFFLLFSMLYIQFFQLIFANG